MTQKNNPILEKWTGPYQGVPPFEQIRFEHFRPAIERSIEDALAAYQVIAANAEEPTFANTLVELEKVGIEFERRLSPYGLWVGSLSTPELRELSQEMAPKLSALADTKYQNERLFSRIKALYETRNQAEYTAEQRRLITVTYESFLKNGAALNSEQKKAVAEINQQLSRLQTQFRQNLLADEENEYLHITEKNRLEGVPEWLVSAAKVEAERRKVEGWAIANTRSSMQPFLTYAADRALRKKAFEIFTSRGDNSNQNNNNEVAQKILKLRAERAKILGFETYAHWQLSDGMAKTPKRALALMMQVWKPAIAQVKKDVAAMRKIAGFTIEPWDYRYYAEKLRKQRYDFDETAVKPYLQLQNVQAGMFLMAKKLYGYDFQEVKNVPIFHPDVTVFEVRKSGQAVGLWYFDPYARPGKGSGAWMDSYRAQHRLESEAVLPIVSNNSNFVKSSDSQPTTISWDDASTMFHEFGHALHGLSSDVKYPSLSGTSTARDFVEFPSQVHEDWLSTTEVLKLLKNQSGEPLPAGLVKKIKRAANFNEGFAKVEYLASALVDMKLHLVESGVVDVVEFEKSALRELHMPKEIVMRHRIPQFAHVFGGESYASGYYTYLWADVLRHDAFNAFLETKNPFDPATAKRFLRHILSVGNSVDPEETYRQFRGRDPEVQALLKNLGFQ